MSLLNLVYFYISIQHMYGCSCIEINDSIQPELGIDISKSSLPIPRLNSEEKHIPFYVWSSNFIKNW